MKKKSSARYMSSVVKSKFFWPGLIVLFIVLMLLKAGRPADSEVNLIDTQAYGPVESSGMLLKESSVGQPGVYLFYDELGNVVELNLETDLDPYVGRPVYIIGDLAPAAQEGGRSVLTPESIEVQ